MPLIALLGMVLLGHPLHTTHTELAEQPGGGVTIEIRAFSDDLQAAVERGEGAMTDSAVARYVRRTVRLTSAGGRRAELSWAGAEPDGDVTRLRFRAVVPGGLAGARLSQEMQTALFADQVNVVQARYRGRRVSLLFLPGDPAKPLP